MSIAALPIMISDSYAQIGPPSCVELGNCFDTETGDTPFGLAMMPFQELGIGSLIYVLFWGLALFMIQLISHSAMLTGMVGTIIALALISADEGNVFITNAASEQALFYGYILAAVGIGVTLYGLISTKLHTA